MSLDLDLELPPPAQSQEWAQFEDDVETSLFEAAVVGDLGFADRVFGSWQGDPDFGAPVEPDLPDSRPADPIEGMGAAAWLRTVAVAQSRADARWLAAIHYVAHHGGRATGGVVRCAMRVGSTRSRWRWAGRGRWPRIG